MTASVSLRVLFAPLTRRTKRSAGGRGAMLAMNEFRLTPAPHQHPSSTHRPDPPPKRTLRLGSQEERSATLKGPPSGRLPLPPALLLLPHPLPHHHSPWTVLATTPRMVLALAMASTTPVGTTSIDTTCSICSSSSNCSSSSIIIIILIILILLLRRRSHGAGTSRQEPLLCINVSRAGRREGWREGGRGGREDGAMRPSP